ncbi:MDR family oxidoreductase [Comamonas serinivorans]|nr:MDR family oxidoreductase [Comamonas serinivorans]
MDFQAVVLTQDDARVTQARLQTVSTDQLPDGDVQVAVSHSTLNYKDGLAMLGRNGVVRAFPMVPGIDLAGTVVESRSDRFKPGDAVLLNGWGVGEVHWGGLAQQARVKADWLQAIPSPFSALDAMSLGTAGYTAMLSVMALQDWGLQPGDGPVLVTGANGGVGTVAISLLHGLGFEVHASTGRPQEADYLKALGASQIVDRSELNAPAKPLQKERWAGAVDCVGSHTLANVCGSLKYGGAVAACGLAQGLDLPASVAPFILRGVALLGIDSVYAPRAKRERAWERLARELKPAQLAGNTRVIGLGEAIDTAHALMAGQVRGRVVVDTAR